MAELHGIIHDFLSIEEDYQSQYLVSPYVVNSHEVYHQEEHKYCPHIVSSAEAQVDYRRHYVYTRTRAAHGELHVDISKMRSLWSPPGDSYIFVLGPMEP